MKEQKISKIKAGFIIFLCLASLSIGQIVQDVVEKQIKQIDHGYGIGAVVSAMVYIAFVYGLLTLICKYVLHASMQECRIGSVHMKLRWLIVAIVLPLGVTGISVCFPGTMIANELSRQEMWGLMMKQVFVYGISGGIVEEMIFRGVIMSSVEKASSRRWAIIVPSIIFALGHVANANDVQGAIMILIAGTCVAVMFSLITYESDTIWCGAIIHILWNSSVLGGIINVSTERKTDTIFSYVIENTNRFTDGLQNVESSVIAIAAYCLIAAYAYYCAKRYRKWI